MAKVLNKEDIEKRIEEFYDLVESIETEAPCKDYPNKMDLKRIRIEKLSAYADYRIGVGGYCVDDDEDEDIIYDEFLTKAWALSISESVDILPSTVLINEEASSITFEWTPVKPLYVSSMEEYCKLYETFVDFLERSFIAEYVPVPEEVEICFSALYTPMFYTNNVTNTNEDCLTDEVFSKEIFSSPKTFFCTRDRIIPFIPSESGHLGIRILYQIPDIFLKGIKEYRLKKDSIILN